MALSQKSITLLGTILCLCTGLPSYGTPQLEKGYPLFLARRGEASKALEWYLDNAESIAEPDALLEQIALEILHEGARSSDPESQLLAMFGAMISADATALPILEQGLQSRLIPIQLVAIQAIGEMESDWGDLALTSALGSGSLEVRFLAISQLCKTHHPQAASHLESLIYKLPKRALPAVPPLLACLNENKANHLLHRLLHYPREEVRVAALHAIARAKRDDFAPEVRKITLHSTAATQEAAAYTLGKLQDGQATSLLTQLLLSPHETVRIAAANALLEMGSRDGVETLFQLARSGNVFAIYKLRYVEGSSELLLSLLSDPRDAVRLNAALALLDQHDERALDAASELFSSSKTHWLLTTTRSQGNTLKGFRHQFSAPDAQQVAAHQRSLTKVLRSIQCTSPTRFLHIAQQILDRPVHHLVPATTALLSHQPATEANIACLKKFANKLGAPLVRYSCILALYGLKEEGPYQSALAEWFKHASNSPLIEFESTEGSLFDEETHVLSPAATSMLLLRAFEVLASSHDSSAIQLLVDALAHGHAKNKYALAGLLVRAIK